MRVVIIVLLCAIFFVACAQVESQQQPQQMVNETINESFVQNNQTKTAQEETPVQQIEQEQQKDFRMTVCTDSDGGYKVFTKGYAMARGRKVFDTCVTDVNPQNVAYTATTLIEYYCRGDRYFNQKFNCPHGCEDGACIKSNETIALYE